MVKRLSGEEIKSIIYEELKKSKHILTFGTIGSCNIENDIDMIITKKANSSTSDFYREVHNLYDFVDDYLKNKYSKKLCVFSGGRILPEQLKISNYQKGDLVFDVMTYISFKELENDWCPYMPSNTEIKPFLEREYNCILGKTNLLFTDKFTKKTKNDHLFLVLMKYDKLKTKYPESFLVECMNYHFDYILRKKLGLKTIKADSEKEVKEVFYHICDILDK